jgi:simple sugar transport system permease protein
VLVFVFFALTAGGSGLFSAKGIVNFLEVSAQLGILAAPVSLLMIAGEFDLSVGSMIGFAGVLIAIPAVFWGWPVWLCLLFAFAVCGGIGALNGLAVVKTGLPSFIVTLGGLFMLRGLTLGLTRGISGRTQVSGLHELAAHDPLNGLFSGQVFSGLINRLSDMGLIGKRADGLPSISGIPVSIVWWVALTLACTWLLSRTRYGNWIFAAGGDANAARNLGVPVARTKITLFVMTALAATLFAAIQVLVTGSADTLRGTQKEFEAIIAVVIGGTLLTGGYGSAIGAMFGALIFGVVQMGIFYTGIDTDWFKLFMGAMMVLAVLFNSYVRNRAMRSR